MYNFVINGLLLANTGWFFYGAHLEFLDKSKQFLVALLLQICFPLPSLRPCSLLVSS